jgi:UV DNA damage endonuclease
MELGYACINMTLGSQKPKITTNRSMIKKTFKEKGIPYASELGIQNCRDLSEIIKWNHQNGINFFRLSSDLFPWASEYNLTELPHYNRIKTLLAGAGHLADKYNQRISSHPGPFNVLVSPREHVVQNTITDLTINGEVFDLMGLSRTPYNKINIHCNGVYGDKISAMDRFCKNFERLPESVQTRLTVENDDKASMYSVKDLMYIHERIGIPIVFDYHHHQFCTGDLSEEEALNLAVSTWPKGITPAVHYSESKALNENLKVKPQAHSDYIKKIPNTYGLDVDIMVEAKAKELTVLEHLQSIA